MELFNMDTLMKILELVKGWGAEFFEAASTANILTVASIILSFIIVPGIDKYKKSRYISSQIVKNTQQSLQSIIFEEIWTVLFFALIELLVLTVIPLLVLSVFVTVVGMFLPSANNILTLIIYLISLVLAYFGPFGGIIYATVWFARKMGVNKRAINWKKQIIFTRVISGVLFAVIVIVALISTSFNEDVLNIFLIGYLIIFLLIGLILFISLKNDVIEVDTVNVIAHGKTYSGISKENMREYNNGVVFSQQNGDQYNVIKIEGGYIIERNVVQVDQRQEPALHNVEANKCNITVHITNNHYKTKFKKKRRKNKTKRR